MQAFGVSLLSTQKGRETVRIAHRVNRDHSCGRRQPAILPRNNRTDKSFTGLRGVTEMRRGLKVTRGGQEVLSIKLDADEASANSSGGDERGARSAKWVEDDAVMFAECANERFERLRWLLCRVLPVLRVREIHHIRERIAGR